ncbi:CoA-binding protein [Sphingobacterium sp. SRCM116780]|uniref:CoA-binding protein n=1 Tax=Sphingobacterium sp. SRCM116780 TaxID=2907623 RepID=UPI001F258C90|nr:CoA-binding protein [Sphingobacterium sp. SRCM116780]UIR55465.1 CoA-binding protein [Sphingobacterium sp. SRCM116780]
MKKTLIIGASTNPERYSYKAAYKLTQHGHDIVNIGLKKGEVAGVEIEKKGLIHDDIDTVTMYVSAANQKEYYDYILATKPKRIIFNPGAENSELTKLAQEVGIQTENACTLVLLSTNQY